MTGVHNLEGSHHDRLRGPCSIPSAAQRGLFQSETPQLNIPQVVKTFKCCERYLILYLLILCIVQKFRETGNILHNVIRGRPWEMCQSLRIRTVEKSSLGSLLLMPTGQGHRHGFSALSFAVNYRQRVLQWAKALMRTVYAFSTCARAILDT